MTVAMPLDEANHDTDPWGIRRPGPQPGAKPHGDGAQLHSQCSILYRIRDIEGTKREVFDDVWKKRRLGAANTQENGQDPIYDASVRL